MISLLLSLSFFLRGCNEPVPIVLVSMSVRYMPDRSPIVSMRLTNTQDRPVGFSVVVTTKTIVTGEKIDAIGVDFLSANETKVLPAGFQLERFIRYRVSAKLTTGGPEPVLIDEASIELGNQESSRLLKEPLKVVIRSSNKGCQNRVKRRCVMSRGVDRTYRLEVRRSFAVNGDGFRHVFARGAIFEARVRTYHRGGLEVTDLHIDHCGPNSAPAEALAVPCGYVRFAEDVVKPEGSEPGRPSTAPEI